MASADELRAQLRVAELEERLSAAKDPDSDDEVTRELKDDLRYARWVARGGPDTDPDDDNRATAALRERWADEQGS